jgi:L-noviosyl transferase
MIVRVGSSAGGESAVRVLFSTIPLFGHFSPMVALAWGFRAGGHEVRVACHADFAGAVARAGLMAEVVSERLGVADYARWNGNSAELSLAESGRGWAGLGLGVIEGMEAVVSGFGPDLVVSEPAEYAGRIVAGRAGIPFVLHHWGIAAPSDLVRGAEKETGRHPVPRAEADLYPCPPDLLQPDAKPGTHMRYVPYNGAEGGRAELPERGRAPRVLLTFGSLLPRYGTAELRALLPRMAGRLADDGFEVIMAMDPEAAAGLGGMPEGVFLAGWVPLDRALPTCDVIVHHGGMGCSSAAVTHGIPQVLVPQGTDQFVNAGRLAACGVGVALTGSGVSADSVAEAEAELAGRKAYRVAARELAERGGPCPPPLR